MFLFLFTFDAASAAYVDCVIECKSDDDASSSMDVDSKKQQHLIACHKCILVARSEYFRHMFSGGNWLESRAAHVKLSAFPSDLTSILVDYFYTDELVIDESHLDNVGGGGGGGAKSRTEKEIEMLFNLYVMADQFLVERVKSLCELRLANLVGLKTVAEIVQFAHDYGATQLKQFAMQFCALNLATLIESKHLDSLAFGTGVLADLSAFYVGYFDVVGSRRITPYANACLEPDRVDLVPLELIYDQRFVDATTATTAPAAFASPSSPAQSSSISPENSGGVQTRTPPRVPLSASSEASVGEKMLKTATTTTATATDNANESSREHKAVWEKVGKKVNKISQTLYLLVHQQQQKAHSYNYI